MGEEDYEIPAWYTDLFPQSPKTTGNEHLSPAGVKYSGNLSPAAEEAMDRAHALMKEIGNAEIQPNAVAGFKEHLFETVCDLHEHLATMTEQHPEEEEAQKAIDATIAACLEHLQSKHLPKDISEGRLMSIQELCDYAKGQLRQFKVSVSLVMKADFEQLCAEGDTLKPLRSEDTRIQAANVADFKRKVSKFQKAVSLFEDRLISSLAAELNVSLAIGMKIFRGAQNNWKGFYEEIDGVIKQTHNIPHLKIYKIPDSDRLVADFGLDVVGSGTYKRAKALRRIGGEAHVRLSSVSRGKERELEAKILAEKDPSKRNELRKRLVALQRFFLEDIQNEDEARSLLSGVPNIAGMTKIQYWSTEMAGRPSRLKTRYIMTKYEGDLWSLAISKESGDHEKALQCCRGVLDCLHGIHGSGYVHGDLKPSNVLFRGAEGFVADFGLLSRVGNSLSFTGTPLYMAPETFFIPEGRFSSQMDMFSFGIMLLAIVDRKRYILWQREMMQLQEEIVDEEVGLDEKKYKKLHTRLQADLAQSNNPFCKELIHDLINYNPEDRPSCDTARAKFTSLLDSQPLPAGKGCIIL